MINRDRMSEAEWMQRLVNLRNRLERDSDNVYDLSNMMEAGRRYWSPIAYGEEQKQLLKVGAMMLRARDMLTRVIDNHHAEA